MASVKSRRNPKTNNIEWRARYRFKEDDKVRQSKTKWCNSKEEAIVLAERLAAEKSGRRFGGDNPADRSIPEALEDYISTLKDEAELTKNNVKITSNNTHWRRARTIYNKFMPIRIRIKNVSDISSADWKAWADYINTYPRSKTVETREQTKDKELSGRTVRNYIWELRLFNDFLEEEHYYERSGRENGLHDEINRQLNFSYLKLKSIKQGVREDRQEITFDMFLKIVDYYNDRLDDFQGIMWSTLWYTLYFTGLRVEELVALRWRDFRVEDGIYVLDIHDAITERDLKENVKYRFDNNIPNTKTKGSERYLPLFKMMANILLQYKNEYIRELKSRRYTEELDLDGLFIFPYVNAVTGIWQPTEYTTEKKMLYQLGTVCKSLGIKTSPQMFRHAFASMLIKSPDVGGLGMDPKEVFYLLGHVNEEQILQTYAKLNKEERLKKSIMPISSILYHVGNKPKVEPWKDIWRKVEEKVIDNLMSEKSISSRSKTFQRHLDEAIARGDDNFPVAKYDAPILYKLFIEDHKSISTDYMNIIELKDFYPHHYLISNGDDESDFDGDELLANDIHLKKIKEIVRFIEKQKLKDRIVKSITYKAKDYVLSDYDLSLLVDLVQDNELDTETIKSNISFANVIETSFVSYMTFNEYENIKTLAKEISDADIMFDYVPEFRSMYAIETSNMELDDKYVEMSDKEVRKMENEMFLREHGNVDEDY